MINYLLTSTLASLFDLLAIKWYSKAQRVGCFYEFTKADVRRGDKSFSIALSVTCAASDNSSLYVTNNTTGAAARKLKLSYGEDTKRFAVCILPNNVNYAYNLDSVVLLCNDRSEWLFTIDTVIAIFISNRSTYNLSRLHVEEKLQTAYLLSNAKETEEGLVMATVEELIYYLSRVITDYTFSSFTSSDKGDIEIVASPNVREIRFYRGARYISTAGSLQTLTKFVRKWIDNSFEEECFICYERVHDYGMSCKVCSKSVCENCWVRITSGLTKCPLCRNYSFY